jgi:hypothetical protein
VSLEYSPARFYPASPVSVDHIIGHLE